MQIPLLHQQILLQTERLRDLHRSIMQHSSPAPSSEMENLIQEIRKLYALALELNNENALQLLNEVHLAVNQIYAPLPNASSAASGTQINKELTATVEKIPAVELNKEVIPVMEIPQQNINHTVENNIEKKRIITDVNEKFHETHTVATKFADHQTVADKIAGNEGMKRISDSLRAPVKDIKAAIGLNEKFQFINQLFNGDAQKYNAFIDELNISPSSEIAMKSIQKVSDSNNWELHASSAKSFMDIIERRYSA